MAIVSSGALIDTLRQHRLLSDAQLTELPRLANGLNGRFGEARAFARLLGQRGWLTIYQINQLLAGNASSLIVGPYLVLDRLGEGGLSAVYKARHVEYGWVVAIKLIEPDAMASEEGRQQFLQEVDAMARLDHPNIVQFLDVDQAGDTFYFAMEFVEGTDLMKHVALSGPLPVLAACDYVRQAALGLQHAHEHNLVHRDIKPANLYLTQSQVRVKAFTSRSARPRQEPLIKILDWGLAALRHPKGQSQPELLNNLAKGIVGTADYLAPEQARNHLQVDIRGDIYSLGCTLYFLLTGQPPFPEGALVQKLMQHQQTEPAPISSFREDVPAEVIGILRRMMAKDPADRFQTPAAVALALLPFTKHDLSEITQLCRKVALAKSTQFRNDDTPMPTELGGLRRQFKAGPQRTRTRESDTARPEG